MNYFVFIFLSGLALNSMASDYLNWSDLEIEGKYHLGQEIIFEKDQVTLPQGTAFLLTDIVGGELPVLLLTFKNLLCTDENLQTEMVLHLLDPNDRDSAIGVVLDTGCTVNMYVEPRHYFGKSLFVKNQ